MMGFQRDVVVQLDRSKGKGGVVQPHKVIEQLVQLLVLAVLGDFTVKDVRVDMVIPRLAKYKCWFGPFHRLDDEDGGRRQRTRRESDRNVMVPGAAQPRASKSIEPSGAASSSYRSRETTRISAEAKSSSIQKGNLCDFGMEKKRKRVPG